MSLSKSRVLDTRTRIANDLRQLLLGECFVTKQRRLVPAELDAAMPDASDIERAIPALLERQLAIYDRLLATFNGEHP